MNQAHALQIGEQFDQDTNADAPEPASVPTRYDEDGEVVEWRQYNGSYSFRKFIDAVLDRAGVDADASDAVLVGEIAEPEDVHFGVLAVFPDETLLFAGSDPTAKDSIPWFAYLIHPGQPVPAPETARDALDRLKPPAVQDVEVESDWLPARHGEWWLLPTGMLPAGSTFTPGVAARPYGPSPLGNHVPREYGFTVPDAEFMDKFHDQFTAPASLKSPPEVIDWTHRQLQKDPVPDRAPDWADIRDIAGEILVRGTVRHRDDDHYVEDLGETWHRALTHDVEVYTGDGIATDVHLDYHGL